MRDSASAEFETSVMDHLVMMYSYTTTYTRAKRVCILKRHTNTQSECARVCMYTRDVCVHKNDNTHTRTKRVLTRTQIRTTITRRLYTQPKSCRHTTLSLFENTHAVFCCTSTAILVFLSAGSSSVVHSFVVLGTLDCCFRN